MKKLLLTIALALPCLAASQQTASAWTSFNLGIGANISFESGGNSILWGALSGGGSGCAMPCAPCGPYGCYGAPAFNLQAYPTPCYGAPGVILQPYPAPCYGAPAFDGYSMGSYGAPAQGPNHRAVYYTPSTSSYYSSPAYGYDW